MNPFHDALPTLSDEAIEVARAFTIGELEPRLVEGDDSPLHFLPLAESAPTAPLMPCLLVDVAMPNRYVRIPLVQRAGEAPRLGAAELWRVDDETTADEGSIAIDYVPLFEELKAQLYA